MALSKTRKEQLSRIFRFLGLLLAVIIFFLPIVSMVLTSLKTMPELFRFPANILPEEPQWQNYAEAWNKIHFGRYLINSIILTVFYSIPCILSSCLAGYGFARFQIKENKPIFIVVLSSMMIPLMVTIMPFYLMMSKIGMVNKRWLWIIWGIQGLPFIIFLFKQFFSTIPVSFEESARLDGAGRFRIFFTIMFPLVQTGIIIAAIFAFHWSWSDYVMPVLFFTEKKVTLAVKLAVGYSDQKENLLFNLAMAGIVYYTLPVVIVFFSLQKQFVAGLLSGGLKG